MIKEDWVLRGEGTEMERERDFEILKLRGEGTEMKKIQLEDVGLLGKQSVHNTICPQ